jgi:hypothetical protein
MLFQYLLFDEGVVYKSFGKPFPVLIMVSELSLVWLDMAGWSIH